MIILFIIATVGEKQIDKQRMYGTLLMGTSVITAILLILGVI